MSLVILRCGSVLAAHPLTVDALKSALEGAGIEFIAENGGGAGVRLKHKS